MKRLIPSGPLAGLTGLCFALIGLAAAPATHADALSTVQMLRAGGCGGLVPAARPLRRDLTLDRAAAQWAHGWPLAAATGHSGYRAAATSAVHVSGPDDFVIRELRHTRCRAVAGSELRDIGVYHRGPDTWLVLASTTGIAAESRIPAGSAELYPAPAPRSDYVVPAPRPDYAPGPPVTPDGSMSAVHALELVNEVRARGTLCGTREYAPAPPLTLSGTLGGVALGHAADMAQHDYFEHVDPAGQTPADRVRAVGYRERLVGENIAYGPESVDDVVKGWLGSPGHCANIMDPRFQQMGFAYATGRHGSRQGLYWVQLFAEPGT
jgi:uncharacterized protein YkwD